MIGHASPIATVDVVLLTWRDDALHVGLLRRALAPFAGQLALPGGYVHVDEDRSVEDAARRVVQEKAGIAPRYLEQLGCFSGPDRDPRGWSMSMAMYGLFHQDELQSPSADFALYPVSTATGLSFDHDAIVQTSLLRLRNLSAYSSLPAFLLPPLFTLTELHQVYEQVLDVKLDPASFRRKIEEQRIIERTSEHRRIGAHRPAQLYRLAPDGAPEFDRRI